MNPIHRLHNLRMENDAVKFAMDEQRPRFERMAGRHENGTAPRAVSAFNLFQTPREVAARLVASLGLAPGARVLEPSAGLGRLLDALAPFHPAEVVAVELAPACAGELYRQERAGVRLIQGDFLDVHPKALGLFDAVVMNPPFHLRADIRHIDHARAFLKPGGRLAALCLDTPHREKALRDLCATWERLDAGTFGKEGTRVATIVLTISAPQRPGVAAA
jgi:predicted RNA methylase